MIIFCQAMIEICNFVGLKESGGRTKTFGEPHVARGPRVWDKALHLDRNFRTFHFREFRKSFIFEARKFFGNNRNFQTLENFAKKLRKKFGNLNSEKSLNINQNFKKNYIKFEI
jgi:hypothetical protein